MEVNGISACIFGRVHGGIGPFKKIVLAGLVADKHHQANAGAAVMGDVAGARWALGEG